MNSHFRTLILFFLTASSAYGQSIFIKPAKITLDNGRHYLHMQVWNCTDNDVRVPLADLPWGENTLGLVLYSAGKLGGEPLKESTPVADFPDTPIQVRAKSHIEGKVDLDMHFHDIARYQQRTSLLIFWEYDLSLITGGSAHFVGGMIPLDTTQAPSRNLELSPCLK